MKPRYLYLSLCVFGTILPLWQLIPFLREQGFALPLLFQQLFSTRAGAFFGMDVLVSSLVLWTLVFVEGRRSGVRHLWIPVVGNLTIGVSLGLPLFLYMRELRLQRAG